MEFLFWILLSFIFYTYFGYPSLLYIKSIFQRYPPKTRHIKNYPHVSIVIAARDEAETIERRIHDIENQDYPKDKLEILIVSDGSLDATDSIVRRKIDELPREKRDFLKLHSHKPSLGKPFCINTGIEAALGEIVVFADCRQRFSGDAISRLVENFEDPMVGCVSGELLLEQTPGSAIQAEMGAYWRFEKWLRKLESDTGSVPGATGAIYAIRKKLFRPLPAETLLDDVLGPMHICMQGFRTIFDGRAVAYDTVSMNLKLEKRRKIRTLAGNWQLLMLEPKLLHPFKNPLWLRFLSHKIFRLLIPYCFITLLLIAFFIRTYSTVAFLIGVFLMFLLSLLPPIKGRLSFLSKLTKIFRSVIFLNYFAFLAPFKLIFGSKHLW